MGTNPRKMIPSIGRSDPKLSSHEVGSPGVGHTIAARPIRGIDRRIYIEIKQSSNTISRRQHKAYTPVRMSGITNKTIGRIMKS
jgi:hypothetical protein